jgi:predicted Zn-ribbon and HTH transcriptional regulator
MARKVRITVWGYHCLRCGYEWVPKRAEAPRVCARCKSPYWDRERTRARRPPEGAGEG